VHAIFWAGSAQGIGIDGPGELRGGLWEIPMVGTFSQQPISLAFASADPFRPRQLG
jgi:hypothetical protein